MPCRTAQIHQAAFRQQEHTLTTRERVLVHLRLNIKLLHTRILVEFFHLDFIVKVTDVAHDRLIFHREHVVNRNNVFVPSRGHKNIRFANHVFQRLHFIAFHCGLQRTNGVNFGHNHPRTKPLHGLG